MQMKTIVRDGTTYRMPVRLVWIWWFLYYTVGAVERGIGRLLDRFDPKQE